MPAPIVPWMPSNIPIEIQEELNRRKTVRSFNFIANNKANWDSNGDWNTYNGPMTPWVRVCSNSAGHPARNKPRFIFHGGKGFYKTYGFQSLEANVDYGMVEAPSSKYQVIGYTPTNPPMPHIIENSLKNPSLMGQEQSNYPIHVPTPEISKITVTVQKELFRRAEVEWTCFSWEQLVYMTPYFLIPGISVMLEWGWNHFNPVSLVNLADETKMKTLWKNSYPLYMKNIIESKGNYDVLYGIITSFNWSIDQNKILCMTEITSKDRLYAGISKDMGLTVNDNTDQNAPRPIYQALRDFISKDATLLNLKAISEAPNPLAEVVKTTAASYVTGSVKGIESQNVIWRDIIRPILYEKNDEVRGVKGPYIRGVFSGRPKKFFNDPIGLGKPSKYDFDKSNVDKLEPSKVWINMGMIVEILNYFSTLDGGKGEPMFQVDIMGSVIGAHPNMISCDRNVLIPNAGAPKVHYGNIGLKNYGPKSEPSVFGFVAPDEHTLYGDQFVFEEECMAPADFTLRRVCYQSPPQTVFNAACFREDHDEVINFLRYKYSTTSPRGTSKGYTNFIDDFSVPSWSTYNLPPSPTGLGDPLNPKDPNSPRGNVVESGVSGLLSNIYVCYSSFSDIVLDSDPKTASYVDIYRKLLSLLNNAVDDFWDLVLIEADNIMTIIDRNYLGTQKKLKQDVNPTYSFDYYDADSIIRSIKFKPTLSDAQATRAIYGEVNNQNSKYVFVDPHDLLNYQFRDAIVMNSEERSQGDLNSDLAKRNTAKDQIRDVMGVAQKLNVSEDDPTLQMTINKRPTKRIITSGGTGGLPGGTNTATKQDVETGPFEYLKLCLPSSVAKQIFRLLIDDKDYDNNPRYCAIQPGIYVDLTLQGIGGLRTFQYFLIKNLPPPYSHRDIIFRITEVHHTISQDGIGWETKITAGILPLRKYIKNRLAPPVGGWAEPTNPTILSTS